MLVSSRRQDWLRNFDRRPSQTGSHCDRQYKQFIIQAFERELGKWRASVRRTDGRLLWTVAAIDRGAFSHQPVDSSRHRRHQQPSRRGSADDDRDGPFRRHCLCPAKSCFPGNRDRHWRRLVRMGLEKTRRPPVTPRNARVPLLQLSRHLMRSAFARFDAQTKCRPTSCRPKTYRPASKSLHHRFAVGGTVFVCQGVPDRVGPLLNLEFPNLYRSVGSFVAMICCPLWPFFQFRQQHEHVARQFTRRFVVRFKFLPNSRLCGAKHNFTQSV